MRAKLILSVHGSTASRDRLLEWLREGGYTVTNAGSIGSGHKLVAEVLTPHGEVDGRPHVLAPARRRFRR